MKTFGALTVIGVLLLLCWALSVENVVGSNAPAGVREDVRLMSAMGGVLLVGLGISNLFQFRDPRKRLPGIQGQLYRGDVIVSWVVCAIITFPFGAAGAIYLMKLSSYQGGYDEFYHRMAWYVQPGLVALFLCLTIVYAMFGMRRYRKFREMVARGEPVCMYCGYDLKGKKGKCPECGTEPSSFDSQP